MLIVDCNEGQYTLCRCRSKSLCSVTSFRKYSNATFRVCSAKNSVSMTIEIQRVHLARVIELAMAQAKLAVSTFQWQPMTQII